MAFMCRQKEKHEWTKTTAGTFWGADWGRREPDYRDWERIYVSSRNTPF